MTDPLVSVVVPVFNRREPALEAVESVLAQTHSNVECIVVDDGSTDGSGAYVATSTSDPRVFVHTQEHAGVSAARNRGIDHAAGDYVTFLDSDDLMLPSRVERQLALLAERGCEGIIAHAQCTEAPGRPLPRWLAERPLWQREAYFTSLFIEAASLRRVGPFDESLSLGEDIDLVLRVRGSGVVLTVTDEVLTVRRFFGDNLTWDLVIDGAAVRSALRRHIARRRAAAE